MEKLTRVLHRFLQQPQPKDPFTLFHVLAADEDNKKNTNDSNYSEQLDLENLQDYLDFLLPPQKEQKKKTQGGSGEEEEGEEGNEDENETEENENENEKEEEEVEEQNLEGVQDLQEESWVYREAGMGLSDIEITLLNKSMVKEAKRHKANSLSFFGKIFTCKSPYYVLELSLPPPEEEDQPDDDNEGEVQTRKEPNEPIEKNIGTNAYTYVVSNSPIGPWTILPSALPSLIQKSRKIQILLTGNLEASVNSHPPFSGQEKDFLRAQIARISAGTKLAPKGILTTEEEGQEEEEEGSEEGDEPEWSMIIPYTEESIPRLEPSSEPKDVDTLKPENWVHINPAIIDSNGRCTLPPGENENENDEDEDEDEEDEGDQEELNKNEEEKEKIAPILSSITHDKELRGGFQSWKINCTTDKTNGYSVTCASSLRWRGAVCVNTGNIYRNMYFGFGIKSDDELLPPPIPEPVLDEGFDLELAAEPSPETAKQYIVIPEKEEDDQGEEEEENENEEEEEDEENDEDDE